MNTLMRRTGTWVGWLLGAVLALGTALMIDSSTSYIELGRSHPFALEKFPLAHPTLWWVALCIHVPSALFSLPACLLLLMRPLRTRLPRFHRWLGRVTGALVLAAVVPSGMYLACFATGGLLGTLGFWLTGAIAFVSMVKSIQYARRRNYRAHRRFSLHVAGQLSVAVFSRLLLVGVEELGLYGDWAYVSALWLPVLGAALCVEFASGHLRWSMWKGSRHEKLVALSHLDPLR